VLINVAEAVADAVQDAWLDLSANLRDLLNGLME
jgi:hypothetical protein